MKLHILFLCMLLTTMTPFQSGADYPGKDSSLKYEIQVDAGAYDRIHSIVNFRAPDALKEGIYELSGENGEVIPVQVDSENRAWFILNELPAGSGKTFTFVPEVRKVPVSRKTGVQMDSNTLTFTVVDRPVLSYYHGKNDPPPGLDERFKRGGYIHPVYSPAGSVLTSHLNTDLLPHQSGIWSAWSSSRMGGRTLNFWELNTGRVDIDTLLIYWEGPVHGGFRARNQFMDLTGEDPEIAMFEHWKVRVYTLPDRANLIVFDLELTQSTFAGKRLVVSEHLYGGLGFRGAAEWNDPETGTFLTSEGLEREGHGTRARWSHIGGLVDGEAAGIAILGHPSNFRFPQPMRIHPQISFFSFAPTQLGDITIEPGVPFVSKYRFAAYDGEPDPALLDRLWKDYAYPPCVTVTKKFHR